MHTTLYHVCRVTHEDELTWPDLLVFAVQPRARWMHGRPHTSGSHLPRHDIIR